MNNDEKLDFLVDKIREIHQRQDETVIPKLEGMTTEINSIKKTIYGNGGIGLIEDVRRIKKIPFIVVFILGMFSTIVSIIYYTIKIL